MTEWPATDGPCYKRNGEAQAPQETVRMDFPHENPAICLASEGVASLPDAALRQHVITLGKTGAGKSSTMRLLVEDLLNIERPVCVIDPKGDWWGIKLNRSGRGPGYPVIIFGG